MGKLSNELPVINMIKSRMKRDDKFTKDQIRDFERRVTRTHSLRFLVEMLQDYQTDCQRYLRRHGDGRKERKRLESVCGVHYERAERLHASRRLIHETVRHLCIEPAVL